MNERKQWREELRAVRKAVLKMMRTPVVEVPKIRLRWWYQPIVGYLNWFWAVTGNPVNTGLLAWLIRRGYVVEKPKQEKAHVPG